MTNLGGLLFEVGLAGLFALVATGHGEDVEGDRSKSASLRLLVLQDWGS